MKVKFLFLFLFCPLFVFSQERISGQVLDRTTRKPISGVVVYTNNKDNITMTDDNGRYILDVNLSEPVYFRQLAYDFLFMTADSLISYPILYLNPHVIELSEVVISSNYTQKLLEKSILNLLARLKKKEAISYLFHVEESTSIGGEREAYALIDATLSSTTKKGRLHLNFNLTQLDKIKEINKDGFYINKRPFWIELFPQSCATPTSEKNIFEIQESNENQIIIKVSPIHPDRKQHRYVLFSINMKDTVLTELITQSLPDVVNITTQKYRGIYYQLINHYSAIRYVQEEDTGFYFYKEGQHIIKAKIYSNSPYYFMGKATDFMIDKSTNKNNTKKKIKPYNYVLFESDFSNSPGFWKQYIK